MDYQEAREYIDNIQESLGSDYSLREVTELAKRMGNPEKDLKIIHIAGTNGKGSVGNFIANMLAASGYSVGRYVSPAVICYRERIQRMLPTGEKIEGKAETKPQSFQTVGSEAESVSSNMAVTKTEFISQDAVARLLTELRMYCEDMLTEGFRQPTAFEIETVMALAMCQEWQVDFVILECGLGGETDATNFISSPLLCVFTSISRDHMSLLGDSISEIAGQKYGIIKENSVVVSGKQEECIELLQKFCVERKAELHLVNEEFSDEKRHFFSVTFCYQGEWYRLSQPAVYQVENAKLAIEVVSQIERMGCTGITTETKKQGIWNSFWRGRFEILSENPFILLDGAHNEDAMDKLCGSLAANYPDEKFVFIIGVFADKEYRKMINRLLPLAAQVLTVTAPGKRGLSGEVLAEELKEIAKNSLLVEYMEDMEQALRQACKFGGKTVICGSLSIQRQVYQAWDEYFLS